MVFHQMDPRHLEIKKLELALRTADSMSHFVN
jgi:hypothetical protein